MTNRIRVMQRSLLLALGLATAACGNGVTGITSMSQQSAQDAIDKKVGDLGNQCLTDLQSRGAVPGGPCNGAELCTNTTGQSIQCPNGCNNICTDGTSTVKGVTCDLANCTKSYPFNVDVSLVPSGQGTLKITLNVTTSVKSSSRVSHSHMTGAGNKLVATDPATYAVWRAVYQQSFSATALVEYPGGSLDVSDSVKFTMNNKNYDRCQFANDGQMCFTEM